MLVLVGLVGFTFISSKRNQWVKTNTTGRVAVASLGLSDIALSTEARYTRHPVASDNVVVGMDYPGSLEHFPSGSFFAPVK